MNIVSESARYSIHLRENIAWSACGNGQKKNEKKKKKKKSSREGGDCRLFSVWGDLDRCIFGPGALVDSH